MPLRLAYLLFCCTAIPLLQTRLTHFLQHMPLASRNPTSPCLCAIYTPLL